MINNIRDHYDKSHLQGTDSGNTQVGKYVPLGYTFPTTAYVTPHPRRVPIDTHPNTMAPRSRKSAPTTPSQTLVIDNGAYTLKAGLVPKGATDLSYDNCTVIPNCIARSARDKRTYVASELAECKDFGELAFRRPVEKGFIVNWEAEKAIWEHEFMSEADGGIGSVGEGLRVGTSPHPSP